MSGAGFIVACVAVVIALLGYVSSVRRDRKDDVDRLERKVEILQGHLEDMQAENVALFRELSKRDGLS